MITLEILIGRFQSSPVVKASFSKKENEGTTSYSMGFKST